MPTFGDLKSGDTLFCSTPPSPDCQLPPTVNSPPNPIPPPTKWPRCLGLGQNSLSYDCNDKMIFVSDWILAKMSKKLYNKQKKFKFCRKIGAKFQTKAQNSPKVHLFWEIWGAIHSTKIPTGLNGKLWSTSKGGPIFSKLFWLDRTDPSSFGPKFLKILG